MENVTFKPKINKNTARLLRKDFSDEKVETRLLRINKVYKERI